MFDCVRLSEKFCIQMILLVQLQLVFKIWGMWLERQLKWWRGALAAIWTLVVWWNGLSNPPQSRGSTQSLEWKSNDGASLRRATPQKADHGSGEGGSSQMRPGLDPVAGGRGGGRPKPTLEPPTSHPASQPTCPQLETHTTSSPFHTRIECLLMVLLLWVCFYLPNN